MLPLGVAMAVAVAFAVHRVTPPAYQSTVHLMVGQSSGTGGYDLQSMNTDQAFARSYVELATSQPVLQAVIAELQLQTDPEQLSRHVKVRLSPEARLLDVTVDSTDAVQAAAIANAIGDQLVALGRGAGDAPPTTADLQASARKNLDDLSAMVQEGEQELRRVDQQLASASGTDVADLRAQRDRLWLSLIDLRRSQEALLESLLKATAPNGSLRVVAAAAVPARPSTPGLALILPVAALVGLAFATAVALAIGLLDRGVRSWRDLPNSAELPYLGSIPPFRKTRGADTLVALDQPHSPAAEALRTIRTVLLAALPKGSPATLLVTSSREGDGKTATTANLAVLLAGVGKRVIVVDADLRNPSLHMVFGVADRPGLADALSDGTGPQPLAETRIPGVRVLPHGATVAAPSEVLANGRLGAILAALKADADVVLIDSPPTSAGADAAVVAPFTDGAVLVARSGMTTAEQIVGAQDLLAATGARLIGIILTRATESQRDGYGYGRRYGAAALPRDESRFQEWSHTRVAELSGQPAKRIGTPHRSGAAVGE